MTWSIRVEVLPVTRVGQLIVWEQLKFCNILLSMLDCLLAFRVFMLVSPVMKKGMLVSDSFFMRSVRPVFILSAFVAGGMYIDEWRIFLPVFSVNSVVMVSMMLVSR